jgi:GT2 family glycosyltransferase
MIQFNAEKQAGKVIDLSIIIVSWNTCRLLDECLASIYVHPPGGDYEIWVVDNNSQDGTQQMVREKYPQVHLIANQENLGFARANNQAISQSHSNYVLCLNPDTEVTQGAIDLLVSFMEQHAEAGGAGPFLLNSDGSFQVSAYPMPTLGREFWRMFKLDRLRNFDLYDVHCWDSREVCQVDVLKGACMLLRREALELVGLFDEDYFIYTEEVDLCYRMNQAGWGMYWVPEAKVMHYEGQSTHKVAAEMFLHLYQTKILFFRKRYGLLSSLIYKLILLLAAVFRLLLSPIALFENKPRRDERLLLARNYRQLLVSLPEM